MLGSGIVSYWHGPESDKERLRRPGSSDPD